MKVEPRRAGSFLLSEAQGALSRDVVILPEGNKVVTGQLVGVYLDDGRRVIEVDGQDAIVFADVDATDGDKECLVIARCAEISMDCRHARTL